MQQGNHVNGKLQWWEENAGFFGRGYMEGDDSLEGYLTSAQTLDERSDCEAAGVVRILGLQAGQQLLDCPTGYGRHALRLARLGLRVTGVDINDAELEVARGHGQKGAEFLKMDMRHLDFQADFDAVINMFYSFGFFASDEENFQVLVNFYNALKPGGRFLMHTDVHIPRVEQNKYKHVEQRRLKSGRQLEIVDVYDAATKRMNGTWRLISNNTQVQELTPYSVRVYTFEEFTDWCYRAGFSQVTAYGDWCGAPLTDESEDMIVIAHK